MTQCEFGGHGARLAMKSLGNSLTGLGVRRPVLNTVANLLIILAGIAAVLTVDVRELPDVDRPIVSVRARKVALTVAEARAEAARLTFRQSLLDAVQEVEVALAAIQSSQNRQYALERAVRASTLSFSQAENLYQQGLIGFLDVVDAQRELADAEQALASERTQPATQIATLFRELGVGVKRDNASKEIGATQSQ